MTVFAEEQEAIAALIAAAKGSASCAFPAADNAAAVGALQVMLSEAIARLSDYDRGAMLRVMDATTAELKKLAKPRKEIA